MLPAKAVLKNNISFKREYNGFRTESLKIKDEELLQKAKELSKKAISGGSSI